MNYDITATVRYELRICAECLYDNKKYYIINNPPTRQYPDSIISYCKADFFNTYCKRFYPKTLDNINLLSKYILDEDSWLLETISNRNINLDIEVLRFILDRIDKRIIFGTYNKYLWRISSKGSTLEKIKLIFKYIDNPVEYCMRKDITGNTIFTNITNVDELQYIINVCGNVDDILNIRYAHERTILFNCHGDIAKSLLESTDNPEYFCNITDIYGRTPLFFATSQTIEVLFQYVVDINTYCQIRDEFGNTALYTNCDDINTIKLILDNVDDPDEYCMNLYISTHNKPFNKTPFNTFKYQCSLLILKYIRDKKKFLYITNGNGDTFLILMLNYFRDSFVRQTIISSVLDCLDDADKISYTAHKNHNRISANDFIY